MARRKTTRIQQMTERKQNHLDLCLREDVESVGKTTLFEEVEFLHNALPDLSLDELDTRVRWLGKTLSAPLLITGMTGGTRTAARINRDLAEVAEEAGIAFGVGSQRVMHEDPEAAWTYQVRERAPSAIILANIGIGQAQEMKPGQCAALVDSLGADGLCVHLNVAQEMAQPEGDRSFSGASKVFRRLSRSLDVPIIAKETGCGISRSVAQRLKNAGIRNVDVSGAGGTSWVRIEALRDGAESRLGEIYRDWGIPTAASLLQLRGLRLNTVASGGIRTGLDVARALALGAHLAGAALPVYQSYQSGGKKAALQLVQALVQELQVAMMLTGSRTLTALRRAEVVLGTRLLQWKPGRRDTGR